jgi:GNAT superfamily N-acetyltransferase
MSNLISHVVRPDGRLLVRPAGEWTVERAAAAVELADRRGLPALAHIPDHGELARAALATAGFVEVRRQAVVAIPVQRALEALADASLPPGVLVRSAADLDPERLRLLDDELRQDVPGTSGWRSTPGGFHDHTFADPAFDSRTYLVALDDASGEYLGLARFWMNEGGPRLGLVGVRRERRRQGIAAALLRQALGAVRTSGATEVTTEYDLENEASASLLARLGARRLGTQIELLYDPLRDRTEAPPVQEHSHVG